MKKIYVLCLSTILAFSSYSSAHAQSGISLEKQLKMIGNSVLEKGATYALTCSGGTLKVNGQLQVTSLNADKAEQTNSGIVSAERFEFELSPSATMKLPAFDLKEGNYLNMVDGPGDEDPFHSITFNNLQNGVKISIHLPYSSKSNVELSKENAATGIYFGEIGENDGVTFSLSAPGVKLFNDNCTLVQQ
jgi:hypothetical protein